MRGAERPRNDRDFCKECGARQAGDREGRPYESVTRRCDAGRNPPVTASPCQPPLGKGAEGDGGADVPVAVPKIFALPYGGRLKF